MCVSFAGFGMQSYGGEIALRVYMFALPGACLLAAFLFFPGPARDDRAWRARHRCEARWHRAWRVMPAAAVCSIAGVLVFFVARYGNEAFERDTAWRADRHELSLRARQLGHQAALD